jgi:hypothetical protein
MKMKLNETDKLTVTVNREHEEKESDFHKCMQEMRDAYNILVGKPEEKRPFGGPRCRWGDNMRIVK